MSAGDPSQRFELTPHPQIDGLRALAIIGVVIQHFHREDWVVTSLVPTGYFGVQLFFVISGYLITRILLNCRDIAEYTSQTRSRTLRQFYIRRTLRIFPIYYLTLIAMAVIDMPPVRETLVWHLTYTSNIYFALRGEWHGAVSHLWSLSTEEQFYLFWPWLIFSLPRRRLADLMWGAFALAFAWRVGCLLAGKGPVFTHAPTVANLDTLAMGGLLALRSREGGIDSLKGSLFLRAAFVLGGSGIALMLVLRSWQGVDPIWLSFNNSAVALFFVWLVAASARGFSGRFGQLLLSRPAQYIGKISYGLYLYHLFIAKMMIHVCHRVGMPQVVHTPAYALAGIALSIGVASVSWHWIERPINAWKRSFSYER